MRRPSRVDVVGVAVLATALAVLWGRAATLAFWADEAISTGVASHSLTSIPGHVVEESAPPLYYLVLHVWMSVVGSSDSAVHLLSLLFAVATVPAAMWAGWSLFGRRAGWIAAVLVAICPFPALYSGEARMYTLALLLAVPTVAGFVHAFVYRRRRHLAVFAVSLTLLLYTHNWGLLVAGAAGLLLVPLLVVDGDKRRFVVDAALAFGAVGLAYTPWVPSLLDQVRAGLQPWGVKATPTIVREDVINNILGGRDVFLLLALGAALGLVGVVQGRRWSGDAVALAVLAALSVIVLAVGWRASVWSGRYLAVVVAPVLLLVAVGIARGGQAALAALAVAVVLNAPLGAKGPDHYKSNARAVGAAASPLLRPGDLVVVADPHLLPVAARYLPPGLRYATAWGPVADPDLVEWRDFLDRMAAADPAVTLPSLIAALPAGGRVAVFCPPVGGDAAVAASPGPVPSDFGGLRVRRCRDTLRTVLAMPELREVARFDAPDGVLLTALDGRVLAKG